MSHEWVIPRFFCITLTWQSFSRLSSIFENEEFETAGADFGLTVAPMSHTLVDDVILMSHNYTLVSFSSS